MIFSQKKYADPKEVLNNIVDDKGKWYLYKSYI